MNDSDVIILIDIHTRCVAKNIAYNSIAKHATVLTDIREVSEANQGSSLVFFEPAVPVMITPEIIRETKEMFNVEPVFIYNEDGASALFEDVAYCVQADYSNIEWNLVYAAVTKDSAILEPYLRIRREPLDVAELLDKIPEHLLSPVSRLYYGYNELRRDYSHLLEKCRNAEEQVAIMDSLYQRSRGAMYELRTMLDKTIEENRKYSALLSESYDKTFVGIYNERPRTLYIKQISHVSGMDNFIFTLSSVIKAQYKLSCKVVKLVDSTNSLCLRYIPNNYFYLESSYSTAAVLENEYLVSLGAYSMLFSLLMMNRSGLDILIVHDLRGTPNSALDEKGLVDLTLHEVSGDYAVLSEYDNVISDLSTAPFAWEFSKISKAGSTGAAMMGNHPTIGRVLSYII